jgi:hypothetical protein
MENNVNLIDILERLTRVEMQSKALHKRLDCKEAKKMRRREILYRGLIAVGAALITAIILKVWGF